jgi:hypothetical protein
MDNQLSMNWTARETGNCPMMNRSMEIEQITIGADPTAWNRAGFSVVGDAMKAGAVDLHFSSGEGILGWRLSSGDAAEVDGLPVAPAAETQPPNAGHPNGVTHIDHLVVFTPDLERTTGALEEIGVECRRVREVEADDGLLRQGFFRLGEVILEVVAHPNVEGGPARFWGITFSVGDLDACAQLLGDRLGTIRDAVQPGRRIATVRGSAGLGLPVALISAS